MKKRITSTIIVAAFLAMITAIVMVSAAATPITLGEVATHNTATNCWSALNGDVYDLSSYIPSHPGGYTMVPLCGIDGTQMLAAKHGLGFLGMVTNLKIGVLATTPTNTTGNTTSVPPIVVVPGNTTHVEDSSHENEREEHNEIEGRENEHRKNRVSRSSEREHSKTSERRGHRESRSNQRARQHSNDD